MPSGDWIRDDEFAEAVRRDFPDLSLDRMAFAIGHAQQAGPWRVEPRQRVQAVHRFGMGGRQLPGAERLKLSIEGHAFHMSADHGDADAGRWSGRRLRRRAFGLGRPKLQSGGLLPAGTKRRQRTVMEGWRYQGDA